LADIWVRARSRNNINRAVGVIDAELSADPITKGKKMHEGLLKFLSPPLQILYEVEPEDRSATVLKVSLI